MILNLNLHNTEETSWIGYEKLSSIFLFFSIHFLISSSPLAPPWLVQIRKCKFPLFFFTWNNPSIRISFVCWFSFSFIVSELENIFCRYWMALFDVRRMWAWYWWWFQWGSVSCELKALPLFLRQFHLRSAHFGFIGFHIFLPTHKNLSCLLYVSFLTFAHPKVELPRETVWTTFFIINFLPSSSLLPAAFYRSRIDIEFNTSTQPTDQPPEVELKHVRQRKLMRNLQISSWIENEFIISSRLSSENRY